MRSIANLIIYEDLKTDKSLIYDNTIDNKLFKMNLKKEIFQASYIMEEIRKSLNKKEKSFKEKYELIIYIYK